jgi:hypothetical protein
MTTGLRRPGTHDLRAQATTYLGWLEQLLGDGRRFLLGGEPCVADLSVAQTLWFIRLSPPAAAQLLAACPKLVAWYEGVAAFGHGRSTPLPSADALAISAAAGGHAPCGVDPSLGFEAGAEVAVNALDYGADPIAGRLVGLSLDEVVLQRDDERAGRVHVHFPRIGYQIRAERK